MGGHLDDRVLGGVAELAAVLLLILLIQELGKAGEVEGLDEA